MKLYRWVVPCSLLLAGFANPAGAQTAIVAIISQDAIFIAADSKVTTTDRLSTTTQLKIDSANVVWGSRPLRI